MDRRAFLAAVAAGGLAGCSGGDGTPDAGDLDTGTPEAGGRDDGTPPPGGTPTSTQAAADDVCERPPKDVGITAISVPRFEDDWSTVTPRGYEPLADESVVVGLTAGEAVRAYPLTVLWHHEVVNDAVPTADGERPVLVTYCSLCTSGMVAERLVAGEPATFGVSGQLWRPPDVEAPRDGVFGADLPEGDGPDADVRQDRNLVLYDAATGSYWSQLLAEAICGPRRGDLLSLLPATVTTWGEWRAAHPDTEVLLPPPRSGARNPPYPGSGPPG